MMTLQRPWCFDDNSVGGHVGREHDIQSNNEKRDRWYIYT
jgi:hypothetical protein